MVSLRLALVFLLVAQTQAATLRSGAKAKASANPIRRVVTMLQMMQNKVEAEGKKMEELFDKFMCYCATAEQTLGKSIADAEEKIPQLESDIKEAIEEEKTLGADLEKHEADRVSAKEDIDKATAIRNKEAKAFAAESGDTSSNIAALSKAIPAIEKGMGGAFLQNANAAVLGKLRHMSITAELSSVDRDVLSSFLMTDADDAEKYQDAGPSSEILGILKQMKDEMEADLKEITSTEDGKVSDFEGLIAAKKAQIEAATKAIEEKLTRKGEIAVEIATMKNDLEDSVEGLAEDKKFLADLDKNCALKKKEWAMYQKMMGEELLAIQETIKILNDDDALELFKKAAFVQQVAFVQVDVSAKQVRRQALEVLRQGTAGSHNPQIDLVMLAIKGKKEGFEKVIQMIDDMTALLGKEQVDDDTKKEYCEKEFDKAEDTEKELTLDIADLDKVITEEKDVIENLADEIKVLEDGINALDKSVAEATEQRKEENAEFTEKLASNNAAKELILFAKNRMQKFYNPKLYKPPPKRELTEEERISLNMGGTLAPTNPPGGIAGTGVGLVQSHNGEAPPPPPAADLSFKKKGEESGGVLAMMDGLVDDIDKEVQEMEFEEKDSQEDYEKTMGDASAKRAEDSKAITDKETAKSETEELLHGHESEKEDRAGELMDTKKILAELHGECDWLLSKYEERKTARTNEIDAMKKAKDVLKGADYSLLQTSGRHTRLHR